MNKLSMQIAIAVCCGTALTYAAAKDSVITLKDITVKGEAVTEEKQPVTINSITSEDIEKLHLHRTEDILESVSGVEIGNYNQGGVANTIAMRGFTSGAHGGDAAVFVDGITLNESEGHADGYADMNVIIPLELAQADVYKGPSSALYGNFARGGTVAFNTRKGGEYNKLRLEFGSNQTLNTQGAFGFKLSEKAHNNTALQFAHTEGYQDNTKWIRGNASTKFTFKPTEKLSLGISARAHGSEWEASGYIPEVQFKNKDAAMKQAPFAENDGGNKMFYSERFDIGVDFTDHLKLLGWVYGTQQEFTRYAKFGYDADAQQTERLYDRQGIGTGFSLNYSGLLGNLPFDAVGGVEYYNESTDLHRWNTFNRVREDKFVDRSYNIGTLSEFAQVNMELTQYFRPLLGMRLDQFFGENENKLTKVTSDINDYFGFSPKAGFSSLIIEPLDFRFSYSRSFKLPNSESKYQKEQAVDPTLIRQLETGLNLKVKDIATADLAAYILETDNEIQQNPDDAAKEVYINIGKTRRMGIEFDTKVTPLEGLEISGHVGGFKSEIIKNVDKTMEGKMIPNAPELIAGAGVRYTSPIGLGLGLKYRKVGEFMLDDMNEYSYDGYDLLSGDIFYTINGSNDNKYHLFLSVENIADEHYSQAIWEGYGTLNYAVGSPRTVSGGVQIDW